MIISSYTNNIINNNTPGLALISTDKMNTIEFGNSFSKDAFDVFNFSMKV